MAVQNQRVELRDAVPPPGEERVRQVEEELRRSEERLQLALATASLETWDWDVASGVLASSPGAAALVGFPSDTTTCTYAALLRRVHPADRPTMRSAVRGGRESGHDVIVQFRVFGSDDAPRWLEARGRTVRDRLGRPARMIGTLRDVTARKERECRAARMARSEKLQTIGQMASGVAHDLSQSLALIAGYTDLARELVRRLGVDAPRLTEALDVAAQAAVDAGEGATRLLEFSRGQPSGEAAPVDAGALLRDVARLTAPRWRNAALTEGRSIGVRVEADGGDLTVRGWASSLREGITNLVFNAVDALPNGGDICLTARRRGDRVAIEVADTGTGMSPKVQERIFEPFFTTKGEVGTGLGLPRVRDVVESHGGAIEVESAPGRGTTFSILLPAAGQTVKEAARPLADAGRPGEARLRVLAVDDDPRLGRMLRAMLARHDVVTATSGEQALEYLAARRFDLVISDLGMGSGMNGWELAERVRREWPEARFVLATGWGATISEEEARRRGVEAVMTKPFSVRRLWQLLERPPG